MNRIGIDINLIMYVCSFVLFVMTVAFSVKGEYDVSTAIGIMNVSGILLYRMVKKDEYI